MFSQPSNHIPHTVCSFHIPGGSRNSKLITNYTDKNVHTPSGGSTKGSMGVATPPLKIQIIGFEISDKWVFEFFESTN